MSELLDRLQDDDPQKNPTIMLTDTKGNSDEYEFLDIISFENGEYAVLSKNDGNGYLDFFLILNGDKEQYELVEDESLICELFEIFKTKNEDEFDFF